MSKKVHNDNDVEQLILMASNPDWSERENALVIDMMRAAAKRAHEATHDERLAVIRFCNRHPNIKLGVAAAFFERGEHLK